VAVAEDIMMLPEAVAERADIELLFLADHN
jgi:hypothetical protein